MLKSGLEGAGSGIRQLPAVNVSAGGLPALAAIPQPLLLTNRLARSDANLAAETPRDGQQVPLITHEEAVFMAIELPCFHRLAALECISLSSLCSPLLREKSTQHQSPIHNSSREYVLAARI